MKLKGQGGEYTKFGDVISAVASAIVLVVIVSYFIELALNFFVSVDVATSELVGLVQTIVAFFVSATIVGFVFARRIWSENGLEAITKITLLSAVFLILYVTSLAALPSWGTFANQAIATAYPNASFSASQLLSLETRIISNQVFLNVVTALGVGFAGFYIGSKLKKITRAPS
jgi:hypothetical protein